MSDNKSLLDMSGRVALITGAGQGVGRAIAIQMARENAAGIIINDYFGERAETVAEEIRAMGGNNLGARFKKEMEGVAQHNLCAGLL